MCKTLGLYEMPNNISKRISLTNAQKRQLCLDKEKKPAPTNGELGWSTESKEKLSPQS